MSHEFCTSCGGPWELFMVHNDLWARFGNGRGVLCLSCMGASMGRPVEVGDLNMAPCNGSLRVLGPAEHTVGL